jgi:hypothetical protein
VSQQPLNPATPLHTLPAQHTKLAAPHDWQLPLAQTCVVLHIVPASMQPPSWQQLPPVH